MPSVPPYSSTTTAIGVCSVRSSCSRPLTERDSGTNITSRRTYGPIGVSGGRSWPRSELS